MTATTEKPVTKPPREEDPRHPMHRLTALFDEGTMEPFTPVDDSGMLAALRDDALLVNLSRGPVVDTGALVAELDSGRIRAALDVTDPEPLPEGHPLWSAPNVLISPHVGGASSAMWPRAYRLVREQLARFAAGEPLVNQMTGDY